MRRFQFQVVMVLGAALLVVSGSVFPASDGVTYDTRALTGDAAPGTDAVFSGFGYPMLNGAGQIAFKGRLTGKGVKGSNETGIWSEGSGALRLVAREGAAAPGTGVGVVYRELLSPVLNDAGQTAFSGYLIGKGINPLNRSGIWSEGSGSLKLVARAAAVAPGTDGVFYKFNHPVLNGAGQTAFRCGIRSGGAGIWSEGSGSLSLVARLGDAAPGTAEGVTFSDVGDPVLNGAGQTAFLSTGARRIVRKRGNSKRPHGAMVSGIWSEGSGSLRLVARVGDAAPDTDEGTVFSGFGTPVLNGAGQTAFHGTITGTNVNTGNETGIWSEGSGSLRLVAREGDAAPGTDKVFYDLFTPVINGAGQIAFRGRMRSGGVGIWLEGSGSLKLVAREGDAAPGTAPGVRFSDIGDPVLNGAGQIAFHSTITGKGVRGHNNFGIWATDPNGQLTLIARTGDLFDVNDDPLIDDLGTISGVAFLTGSGGEDGRATSFNDAGQFAFKLIFRGSPGRFIDGGEGIFVATLPNSATAQ